MLKKLDRFKGLNRPAIGTLDSSYSIPLNPRNGILQLAIGASEGEVIEEPFDRLGIEAASRYYELSFCQPLSPSPTQEFALGLTASRQESQTELGFDDIGSSPLSPRADSEGRTWVSAVRLFSGVNAAQCIAYLSSAIAVQSRAGFAGLDRE